MAIVIQANLTPPGGQVAPQVNPSSFGTTGRALEDLGAFGRGEIDRRIQQRQVTQLATGRAQAQTQIEEFVSSLERDPDFQTYPQRWQD